MLIRPLLNSLIKCEFFIWLVCTKVFFSAFSCQNQHCSYNVTLILSKVIHYSWTSLWISIQDPSLPRSDLSFWTDNSSVSGHVWCLSVWRTHPWSAWLRDFVTNMLPHTSVRLHTAASKRSGRRLEFHIYPSCLDFSPGVCVWMYLSRTVCVCVCVWMFVCPNTSLLVPVCVKRA